MQTSLVQHYTAEFLNDYLEELSHKFPMSPLSAVLQNHLYHSDDGTEANRLKVFGAQLYNTIKVLEELPDAASEVKEDPEYVIFQMDKPIQAFRGLSDEIDNMTPVIINPDSLK